MTNNEFLNWNMGLALEEADNAFRKDEVPVGALIVDDNGLVVAKAHNQKENNKSAIAHAEMIAISLASKKLGDWRLENYSIFVTLEPCLMCLSAILQSRLKNLYFGAYDLKAGSISLGYNIYADSRFNHKFNVFGGVRQIECSAIMSSFFKQKRSGYNIYKN